VQVDSLTAGVAETHRIPQNNRIESQEWPTKYASSNEITFVVEDKLWLSTRKLKTYRPSMMLNFKHTGPYTFSVNNQ
jgi:hypothetical protein